MNRQHNRRLFGKVSGARRYRSTRPSSLPLQVDGGPLGGSPVDRGVLSLLSEVLIGDSTWTMAEVQRLVAVRDLAELGRWRAAGLDDAG